MIRDWLGPWRLNRDDGCWERWYRKPSDGGLVHVLRHWIDDPAPERPLWNREHVLRMLYHVVATYGTWRDEGLMPNELMDSTIEQAHAFLMDCDWWPAA